jgi:hypothetical protein
MSFAWTFFEAPDLPPGQGSSQGRAACRRGGRARNDAFVMSAGTEKWLYLSN